MTNLGTDYSLLKAAGAAIFCAVLIAWLGLVTACGPKPPSDLVLYEQPSPQLAAIAHAQERPSLLAFAISGNSMQPLLAPGDWVVVDFGVPFDSLKAGQVCVYSPDWLPGHFVIHMTAARSGDGWIMDGINNPHYEAGTQIMQARHYLGRAVQVYTRRPKP